MPKIKLIFNPASDRGRSGQKASDLQAIVEKMGGADWEATEYPGHAVEVTEQAAREGYEVVVALGGDGTVHEVVNGLMRIPEDQRPQLGVVPIGSGNDFAYNSGVQMDFLKAIQRVYTGSPSPVDIGKITDGNGRAAYFDNGAGMLIEAAVNIQSRKITRIYGFLMYLTAAVRAIIENFDPTHMKMTIDGETREQNMIMFTVGNGAREGGGFHVTPEAKNNDGIFDYLIVDPVSRPTMLRVLPEIMRGTHTRFPFVSVGQFHSLEFEADRAVPIHLDGELWAPYEAEVTRVTVEMFPNAVQVIR